MRRLSAVVVLCCGLSAFADQASDGRFYLRGTAEGAVAQGAESPSSASAQSRNRSANLESELCKGIQPKHPDMLQVRFSPSDIASIYIYLHGKTPDSEYRRPQ